MDASADRQTLKIRDEHFKIMKFPVVEDITWPLRPLRQGNVGVLNEIKVGKYCYVFLGWS